MQKKSGNLFDSKYDAYGHCVARDFYMGRGIAVDFKQLFGNISELKAQNVEVGDVASLSVLHREEPMKIYYLVTKEFSRDKPEFSAFESSLVKLKELCLKDGVRTLGIPKIGCGLDNLHFKDVTQAITRVFEGSGIEVTMHFLYKDRDFYLA